MVDKKPKSIKVIIGLGNPGPKFVYTRHNIGFRVVDVLAEKYNGVWQSKDKMLTTTITIYNQSVQLIKPQTFMNSSGEVVPSLLKKGIRPDMILVIHDELEKPFGSLTFKENGSHKGHNGLRSIIATCGDVFWRLRCGIARPERKEDVPDYVLEKFKEPLNEVESFIDKAISLIEGLFE